jgi:two-component system sensor kinase FixL
MHNGKPNSRNAIDDALAVVFDVVQDPLLLIDVADETILRANYAAAELYEHPTGGLIGMTLPEFSAQPELLRTALQTRRNRLPLSYHLSANRNRVPIEISLKYLELGARTLCVAAIHDLSAQVANEQAINSIERKYQGIFGAAPYPTLVLNNRSEIIEANASALELYGLKADDLARCPRFGELLADKSLLPQYKLPGKQLIPPHQHHRLDGCNFVAEASVAFFRQGRSNRWIVVIRNVTEEYLALSRLHASEERWRFALEGPGSGIWEWNPETDEFFISERFCKMLELPEEIPANFGWWESRIHPDDLAHANEIIMAHLTQAIPLIEIVARLRDGANRYHWAEFRAMAMGRDDHGRTQRVIGTARIIDAEREREQREREQAQHLLHLDRLASVGEMATLIAHELNQPLAAIGNFAAVAHRQFHSHPDEALRAIDLIQTLVQRSGAIVQQVRSFANMKANPDQEIDLNTIVTDIIRLIEHQAHPIGARIHLELATGLPPLRGDPVQIGQLTLNLVKNGLDAMRDGPLPRMLTLCTKTLGNQEIRLIVEDCGNGLPTELVDSLFQPFFTTKPDGLGMGLSICRSIVENHGGTLLAEPRLPHGTRFIVKLPL